MPPKRMTPRKDSPQKGSMYSRQAEQRLEHDDRQSLLNGDSDGSSDDEEAQSPQEQQSPATVKNLLSVRRYPFVLAAGLLFDFARIAMAFLGPYYMNDVTHSPRLVQLTGAASWCFLIAGPCFGVISDRFDRRRTVLTVLCVEAAMAALVGLLMVNGLMQPAFMFIYMIQSSICGVLDTTNRPAMIYDLLFMHKSEHLIGKAMALRSIGSNCGRIFGNQVVGWVVETGGVGWTYTLVSCCLWGSGLLLCCVPSPPKAQPRTSSGKKPPEKGGIFEELAAGASMAWHDKAFMSMLGVTFFANFNYWSHQPLLQVLATRLGADASEAGLLVSASGWGGLLASLMVTNLNPARTGLLYCLGIAAADAVLPGATILNFWSAFAALGGSGFLAGLFGAVQSAMVMQVRFRIMYH